MNQKSIGAPARSLVAVILPVLAVFSCVREPQVPQAPTQPPEAAVSDDTEAAKFCDNPPWTRFDLANMERELDQHQQVKPEEVLPMLTRVDELRSSFEQYGCASRPSAAAWEWGRFDSIWQRIMETAAVPMCVGAGSRRRPEAACCLKWHVDTQLEHGAQKGSELLFPSVNGGFRAGSVLNKPFEFVSLKMNLGFVFTARGMRRTFNDLARTAQVQDLATRSISGHATERMQHHYSTVRGDEQRESIAKVITLMTPNGRSRVETSEYHLRPTTAPQADPTTGPSGTPSGAPARSSGTPEQKVS